MSDNNGEAAELAERAATQAKHATRNAGKAAKAAAEPVLERVTDEAHDIADRLEGAAEEIVGKVRFFTNPTIVRNVLGYTALTGLTGAVSVYSARRTLIHGAQLVGYVRGVNAAKSDYLRSIS